MVTTMRDRPDYASALPDGVEITAPVPPDYASILSPEALAFVAGLSRRFEGRRQEILERRADVQIEINAGRVPDFLAETAGIRESEWTVAPAPADLQDRRVEITGPTDRKMMINALNSGASVFMADFEDANAPTWDNLVSGQINLRDAVDRAIAFESPDGRTYRLDERTAVLMVRPRGWHLVEKHVLIDGQPVSGGLFDFGLYLFHNARVLMERGTGPYFYLPKLEHHLEARLWNDVFVHSQRVLGMPVGTIKATVLIETILAAFQMDEILWELRDHSAGLNCGRWDYIFSIIKKFRDDPGFVLPDRGQVTMTTHMMHSYSLLCIRTCHHRGAHAIGGMSAYIPVRADAAANAEALRQVTADKRREAGDGHDGTWVAHPGLVPVAKDVFDELMPGPNQLDRRRDDVAVSAADLLTPPTGTVTVPDIRLNISVGIRYLESWLRGIGAAAINNLMEDVATSEISRAQIWQWIRYGVTLEDGRRVTRELVEAMLAEEIDAIRAALGEEAYAAGRFDLAASLFARVALGPEWEDFLTLVAYDELP